MKSTILWLDDIRDPFNNVHVKELLEYLADEFLELPISDVNVVWVKTQKEFEDWINRNDIPAMISFDNDLGIGNGEGYECAKFLVDYCLDNNCYLPEYYVHSSNPVAKEYIEDLFTNFKEMYYPEEL